MMSKRVALPRSNKKMKKKKKTKNKNLTNILTNEQVTHAGR